MFRNTSTGTGTIGGKVPRPRTDVRFVLAIRPFAGDAIPHAEVLRRLRGVAAANGLARPSYATVRRLVIAERRRNALLRRLLALMRRLVAALVRAAARVPRTRLSTLRRRCSNACRAGPRS